MYSKSKSLRFWANLRGIYTLSRIAGKSLNMAKNEGKPNIEFDVDIKSPKVR
jgi:hypothetical protein